MGAVYREDRGPEVMDPIEQTSRGKVRSTKPNTQRRLSLLPAANDGTASGIVICGNCSFTTAEACNVMLWDKEANHLVTVLQNDKYDKLDKLIGSI